MIKKIVFDMDNTLIDEFGSTLRPGITAFLEQLKSMNCELYLWTNSSRDRAKEILIHHKLDHYFSKFIYREDYDPENKGVRKDIRKIGGEILPAGYSIAFTGQAEEFAKTGDGPYQITLHVKNGDILINN